MEGPAQNPNDFCIILAGGIGSRLWPLSRASKPKQFLDLTHGGRTMLQLTFRRMEKVVPLGNIYVSTFAAYVPMVQEQLPELPREQILGEPLQLGTAPAVGLAATVIGARNPRANIMITPADQWILNEERFKEQINEGYAFVEKTGYFLTIAIKAHRAETNFGYVQAGEDMVEGYAKVKSFTEKPSQQFADLFVQSGEFYWNTGLFQCRADRLLKALRTDYSDIESLAGMLSEETDAERVKRFVDDHYPRARYRSVDLVILEENTDVCICPGEFGWYDPGDFDRLYSVSQKDAAGNVVLAPRAALTDCHNNLLISDKDTILMLSEVNDCVIVQHGNIVMACKRGDPSRIRRMMQDAEIRYGKETL